MTDKPIAIAADHAGYDLKETLAAELKTLGHEVVDIGTHSRESVDYPDIAAALAATLTDGKVDRGVLICGTGIGISMAANRYPGLRAALCHDETSARLAREHNDANVLVLGARMLGVEVARDCLKTFINTDFAGGRHAKRVAKLA